MEVRRSGCSRRWRRAGLATERREGTAAFMGHKLSDGGMDRGGVCIEVMGGEGMLNGVGEGVDDGDGSGESAGSAAGIGMASQRTQHKAMSRPFGQLSRGSSNGREERLTVYTSIARKHEYFHPEPGFRGWLTYDRCR